eukprot:EC120073.1.p1 GENE.EC120073.1~~EC120073.1.p1  ORF type:complete len:123 (+),score=3.76 EC120073.1:134-502(+)
MGHRQKILRLIKGARGQTRNTGPMALSRAKKAMLYSTRDRKNKIREDRRMWTVEVNAASRETGMPVSQLLQRYRVSDIALSMNMIAALSMQEPLSFRASQLAAVLISSELESAATGELLEVQ